MLKVGNADTVFVYKRIIQHSGRATGYFTIPKSVKADTYTIGMFVESADPDIQWLSGEFVVHDKKHTYTDQSPGFKPEGITLDFKGLDSSYSTRNHVAVDMIIPPEAPQIKSVAVAIWNKEIFGREHNERNIIQLLPHSEPVRKVYIDKQADACYFQGRALLSSGKPVPPASTITFYLHQNDFIYSINTTAEGYFTFPLFKDFDSEEIFYTITHNGTLLNETNVSLIDYLLPVTAQAKAAIASDDDSYGKYMYEREIILDSYKHYLAKQMRGKPAHREETDWSADVDVKMEKYEPFKSMAEVFINVVPMVRYKKEKADGNLRVFLQKEAMLATENPLFIVDGIMTNNIDYVMSLNPALLKRIGVLRSERSLVRYGDLGAHGIVLINTSIPDHAGIIPRTSQTFFATGISPFRTTRSTRFLQFSDYEKRIPDLRPVLFWHSASHTDGNLMLDFVTSDDVGEYIIQAYVIDINDILHVASATFQVVPD